ncbi:MAG: hypothetical protein LBB49_06280, partial [Gracilibacteraceae bacterium]|nr:hypothetical protein [Gracilibacteraceae bacterium]
SRQRDRLTGQITLFDLVPDLTTSGPGADAETAGSWLPEAPPLPKIAEFPQDSILKMEREYLGLYLTHHPLDQIEPYLKTRTSVALGDLAESNEDQKIIIGGLITGLRNTLTKRGDMMASFKLEDLTGSAEILVFPRIFAETPPLANEQIVIIKGRYVVNDEERKVFAEKIEIAPPEWEVSESGSKADTDQITTAQSQSSPTSHLPPPTSQWLTVKAIESSPILKLLVHLPATADHHLQKQLEDTLSQRPGNNPVYLQKADGTLYRAQPNLNVNVTPYLTAQLSSLLESDGVEWIT